MTYLPIMHRPAFEAFVLSLPAATLVRQWRDDSVAKVGGKIFCLLDRDPGEIWLKVSDMSYDLLTEMGGIRPAPYFARAGWVRWDRRESLLYDIGPDGRVRVSLPDARHYYVRFDENANARVYFGDGRFGRRPPRGGEEVSDSEG